ncbi:MBL fold metallo-hydrolase [Streptosporangium lutulentum]
MPDIALTYIGGPTALLEYGGVRFLTDPTFDAPQTYEPRNGFAHTKTHGPALAPSELGAVDLALVSHHHHGDNLDILGAALLRDLPLTISTTKAAEDLGGTVVGLEPWASVQVGKVTITAVPALHGPRGRKAAAPSSDSSCGRRKRPASTSAGTTPRSRTSNPSPSASGRSTSRSSSPAPPASPSPRASSPCPRRTRCSPRASWRATRSWGCTRRTGHTSPSPGRTSAGRSRRGPIRRDPARPPRDPSEDLTPEPPGGAVAHLVPASGRLD